MALVGGLILGEYELTGVTAFVAAVLFGIAVAEAVITVARTNGPALVAAGAVFTAAGFVWAGWIESGRSWEFVEPVTWVAAVVSALAAGGWIRAFGRRGSSPDQAGEPG